MKDLIKIRLRYPSDTREKYDFHDHYIKEVRKDSISVYSICSLLQERYDFVYDRRGKLRDEKVAIEKARFEQNGFKRPSYVNCNEEFIIPRDPSIDYNKLQQRNITRELKEEIDACIEFNKSLGKVKTYNFSLSQIKEWNKQAISEQEHDISKTKREFDYFYYCVNDIKKTKEDIKANKGKYKDTNSFYECAQNIYETNHNGKAVTKEQYLKLQSEIAYLQSKENRVKPKSHNKQNNYNQFKKKKDIKGFQQRKKQEKYKKNSKYDDFDDGR